MDTFTNAYTVKTLADRWSCSIDVVYDMIRQGCLRTFRVGRALRISPAEVDRYESGAPSPQTNCLGGARG